VYCCVFDCVQTSLLESDTEAVIEKKHRRRRKYEDDTDTSNDDDDDDDDVDDDEADKQQVRRRGRARKNLVRGFTGPEIRRLIKSMRKFPRPLDRLVTVA